MQKKKKFIFILSLVIIGVSVFIYKKMRTYTFSEITNNLDKQVVSVQSNGEQKTDAKEILKHYQQVSYKKYSGEIGNTRREVYRFFDKKGKLLFTLTDSGNALNVIKVTMIGKETTYQFSENEQEKN